MHELEVAEPAARDGFPPTLLSVLTVRCLAWGAAGRQPSKRGVGVAFGPDVAERFLKDNNLDLLIRR